MPDTLEWYAAIKKLPIRHGDTIRNTFNLPFAGDRDYSDNNVSGMGPYADYWSSTPYDNSKSY